MMGSPFYQCFDSMPPMYPNRLSPNPGNMDYSSLDKSMVGMYLALFETLFFNVLLANHSDSRVFHGIYRLKSSLHISLYDFPWDFPI